MSKYVIIKVILTSLGKICEMVRWDGSDFGRFMQTQEILGLRPRKRAREKIKMAVTLSAMSAVMNSAEYRTDRPTDVISLGISLDIAVDEEGFAGPAGGVGGFWHFIGELLFRWTRRVSRLKNQAQLWRGGEAQAFDFSAWFSAYQQLSLIRRKKKQCLFTGKEILQHGLTRGNIRKNTKWKNLRYWSRVWNLLTIFTAFKERSATCACSFRLWRCGAGLFWLVFTISGSFSFFEHFSDLCFWDCQFLPVENVVDLASDYHFLCEANCQGLRVILVVSGFAVVTGLIIFCFPRFELDF